VLASAKVCDFSRHEQHAFSHFLYNPAFHSIHGSLKEKNSYHLLWLAKMVFATDTSRVKKSQLKLISSGL
jgi:hypothetical protein